MVLVGSMKYRYHGQLPAVAQDLCVQGASLELGERIPAWQTAATNSQRGVDGPPVLVRGFMNWAAVDDGPVAGSLFVRSAHLMISAMVSGGFPKAC